MPVLVDGVCIPTLKGIALLEAIEIGLVWETEDGKGYDIGPFLRFWENILPLISGSLKESTDEIDQIKNVFEEQCNQGTNQ